MLYRIIPVFMAFTMLSCSGSSSDSAEQQKESKPFKYLTEQFADAKILRYQVPGFETLSLQRKKLIYYLSQAALCGRDITYDQNYKYNLLIRKTLEAIYENYKGDRTTEDFRNFEVYLKRVWFSNGIHHHYSTDKFRPECPAEYLAGLIRSVNMDHFAMRRGQKPEEFIAEVTDLIYNPDIAAKRVCLDPSKDLVLNSASNFYEGVDQPQAEHYYSQLKESDRNAGRDTLISYGLNSKLTIDKGKIHEKVYRSGGLYSAAIEEIVYWLGQALEVAENPQQQKTIEHLIRFYKTGDLATWDQYNISWLEDSTSLVDFVNGFIEVYGDPLAIKGTWESIVNFKDVEATRRTEILSDNAQFFEDHSPVAPEYKKKKVKGVTAKVITVAQLGGECDPTPPIGINLPNSNWIRKEYGSKSVTIDNITYAYDQAAQGNGFMEEFAFSHEEIERAKLYGYLAGSLITDLHECLGHGSGQLLPGITSESLKNYHSTIEEARADLFALYYIKDPELVNMGLVADFEVAKAAYDNFMRNGLMTQLVRVEPGKTIEESHMRDRALIANWIYEKCEGKNIIRKVKKNGKTYIHILDYDNLRWQFGELLKIIQQITSEGDFKQAMALVEKYSVHVDPVLHAEVLERYSRLKLAPYAGFINPVYKPVMEGSTITDIKIEYPGDFATQMLWYSNNYSFLPARTQ